jgi:hypothetical protein
MKSSLIKLFALLLLAIAVHASTPPDLPPTLPPLAPITLHPAPPTPELPLPAITRDVIMRSALSPTARQVMLAGLEHAFPNGSELTAYDSGTDLTMFRPVLHWNTQAGIPTLDWRHYRAVPDLTPTTYQVNNDTYEDREPSIMAIRKSDNVTHFATIGHMRMSTITFNTDTFPLNSVRLYSTSDYQNFSAMSLPLSSPTDWTRFEHQGDPAFAANPYSSGFQQRTIYFVSPIQHYAYNSTTHAYTYSEGAIGVWKVVPDTSTSWSQVALVRDSTTTFPDKPSIAVSWDSTGGTMGFVYVAFADVTLGTQSEIKVYKMDNTSGGFVQTAAIPSGKCSNCQSPQVMVDPQGGAVYVAWLDWTTQRFFITRSTDQGTTWATPITMDAANKNTSGVFQNPLVTTAGPAGQNGDSICNTSSVCIGATTMLSARFNSVDHTVMVAWHRREAGSAPVGKTINDVDTDVWVARFTPATTFSLSSWSAPLRADNYAARDQWNPGLDFDDNGVYLVTYYNRSDDTTDTRYCVYGTKILANFTRDTTDTLLYSAVRGANPTPPSPYTSVSTLGEYKDVWYWFGVWHSPVVYIPDPTNGGSGQCDVYLMNLAP